MDGESSSAVYRLVLRLVQVAAGVVVAAWVVVLLLVLLNAFMHG